MKLKTTTLIFLLTALAFAGEAFEKKPKSLIKANQKLWQSRSIDLQSFVHDTSDSLKVLYTVLRHGKKVGYSYNGRVNSCRQGGCSNFNDTNSQAFEYFDYFVLYDLSLSIKKIKVYNYQSSYGYEICSQNWLSQFVNLKPGKQVKYGKEIDAISGATISANNLINDLQKISTILANFIHP